MHTAHVHILRGSSARPRPVPLRRWLQRIQIYTHPPATRIILPRAALHRLRVFPEQAVGAVPRRRISRVPLCTNSSVKRQESNKSTSRHCNQHGTKASVCSCVFRPRHAAREHSHSRRRRRRPTCCATAAAAAAASSRKIAAAGLTLPVAASSTRLAG